MARHKGRETGILLIVWLYYRLAIAASPARGSGTLSNGEFSN
jgi:hypothetical protein